MAFNRRGARRINISPIQEVARKIHIYLSLSLVEGPSKLLPETATLMRTARTGAKTLMDTDAVFA